jgi:hypothetical protein
MSSGSFTGNLSVTPLAPGNNAGGFHLSGTSSGSTLQEARPMVRRPTPQRFLHCRDSTGRPKFAATDLRTRKRPRLRAIDCSHHPSQCGNNRRDGLSQRAHRDRDGADEPPPRRRSGRGLALRHAASAPVNFKLAPALGNYPSGPPTLPLVPISLMLSQRKAGWAGRHFRSNLR